MESIMERPDPYRTPPASESRPRREEITGARRVVVKLGTRVLVDDEGFPHRERLAALVDSVVALRAAGRDVIVVTSGAVALGRGRLGAGSGPLDPEHRRACAAVGQAALQSLYQEAFAESGVLTAQVLLTSRDFESRRRSGIRATMEWLLGSGVVLVVNENDAVTQAAIERRPAFRDNDGLAALVAIGCHADLLVLLTDVAGVYPLDPRHHPDLAPLERVERVAPLLATLPTPSDAVSRGGMRSKVASAADVARAGCPAVIASGYEPAVVERILTGEPLGTLFPARRPAASPVPFLPHPDRSSHGGPS